MSFSTVGLDNPSSHLRDPAQNIACRLRHLSDTLFELAIELKEEHGAFELFNRKSGLALLPDDILVEIFNLIVNNVSTKRQYHSFPHTWEASMGLSHVCQRFRNVVLTCPRLWTTMHQCGKMVTSCLPRTQELPLSVDLMIHQRTKEAKWIIDPVVMELLPHIRRWNRLGLVFSDRVIRMPPGRGSSILNLRQLDAPLLEELRIKSDYSVAAYRNWHGSLWDWTRWNTPNLRRIEITDLFPHALPGLDRITSLDLTLSVDEEKMPSILKKVSSLINLQDFALELVNCFSPDEGQLIFPYEKVEFPHIRRLEIRAQPHFEVDDCSPAIKRLLFSSLFFPSVVRLDVKLSGVDYMFREWDDTDLRDYYFNKEITRIFRHIDQFPMVESFYLHIHSPLGDHHDSDVVTKLSIPLNMLPNVKHFTLKSNTRLDVEEPEEPDEIIFEEEQEIGPRVEGTTLPVLEKITLDMLDASVIAGWLREYLEKLKERGEWDRFRVLVIRRDEEAGVNFDTKLTYPRDEALDWCSRCSQ